MEDLVIDMPEWALDALARESDITEISASDLALLFLADKVEHTHENTTRGADE